MNPVRLLRSKLGITQQVLASVAGTSQPTIAAYESGTKSPTLETLKNLAESLGLELSVSFVPPMTREDLRSLAYHRAIVEKLKRQPETGMAKARRNLLKMKTKHPGAMNIILLWEQWLKLPLEELAECCLDEGVLARDMRQVTPFAGVLTPKERFNVLKRFQIEELR